VQGQGLVAAQFAPIRVADRRDNGETVETTAQHDREKARVAGFGARDARQIGPCQRRARAEQQGAAGREGEVWAHHHLRRNSGAINSIVSACGLLSARSIAWRVSAEASGPIAASAMAGG